VKLTYVNLGEGEEAIKRTLQLMSEFVKTGSSDFVVIDTARKIIKDIPVNRYDEAAAVFDWVKHHTRFTRDPWQTETLQAAGLMLYQIQKYGIAWTDCDDLCILGASLMRSIGLPAGFRAISQDGKNLTHVYGLVHIAGQWIPWDASNNSYSLGYEPPAARQEDYYVD